MYLMSAMPRTLWIFLTVAVALTSCNPKVQFSEPMPPGRLNLPNIPKAMRGVIYDGDSGDRWEMKKDTLLMGDEVMVNGEDFLLRRMAGHIILNKPVVETGHWEVIPIRKTKDSMFLGYFDDEETFLRRMATLLETAPEPLRSEGTPGYAYSLLSPSAKGFKTILKERLYSEDEDGAPLPKGGEVRP